MKKQLLLIIFFIPFFLGLTFHPDHWISQKQNDYTLFYTSSDQNNLNEYSVFFENGNQHVQDFFQGSFKTDFSIYIHPNRSSLDSAWQKDWKMPGFKSQCWMVASGVAHKLDLISPITWDSTACEHSYANTAKTQQLITHEMAHVFHGQYNKSPDFSEVSGIDWFVEGLATYASGQCDATRISEVQQAITANKIPEKLTEFWTGNLKYGLSGTVVMYLDNKYGRNKLVSLLKYNTIEEVLESLATTELEIVNGWKNYLKDL